MLFRSGTLVTFIIGQDVLSVDRATINPQFSDFLVLPAMTAYNRDLQSIVRGDTKKIERTFTNLPSGITVYQAWLTVKVDPADADPGLFQILITPTATSAGRIVDTTTTDGQISLYFNISGAQSNSAALGVRYCYDIQIADNITNNRYTLTMGTVTFVDGVTDV